MFSCRVEDVRCRTILSLLVSSSLVPSCSGFVNWLYPGAGLTFNYIDIVYFTWKSDIKNPWMNLWCAPNSSSPQSNTQAYHAQMSSTNGTNPRSFPYSEYINNGICHMQVENLAGDNFGNTPTFEITSNDAVTPQTWGLSALSLLGSDTGIPASSIIATAPSSSPSLLLVSSSSSSLISSPSASSSPSSSSPSSSSIILPSTITAAASAARVAPAATSAASSSQTLSTAVKAGISIGSIFTGLALVIAVLLFRITRSRRPKDGKKHLNGFWPSQRRDLHDTHEIDGGAYYEVSGGARPTELQGVPRAELD